MDDLEVNPLHRALLTKFRREFEIACRMSYLVAIPHSAELEGCHIDPHFVNSHILVPSKLLKMHFHQLQAGSFDNIELEDNKRLLCSPSADHSHDHSQLGRGRARRLVVRILAEEIGYNALSKEYRTLLIDRPLVARSQRASSGRVLFRALLAPLSPRAHLLAQAARRQRAQLLGARSSLRHHDDCARYLDCISQELTIGLEQEARRMQTNYIILAQYLEDAAARARRIVENYTRKYERALEQAGKLALASALAPASANSASPLEWLCEPIRRSVRISVENYVVYLLHGKLMAAVQRSYAEEDATLKRKLSLLRGANLSLCQLGAQPEFENFALDQELAALLEQLPGLQSPLAMVSCLLKLMDLISGALNQSVRLKRLLDTHECDSSASERVSSAAWSSPTPICSDDLIATLVFCLPRTRPNNLYSTIRYLETFGWSAANKDQAAYYLATFESAVEYVLNFAEAAGAQQPVA